MRRMGLASVIALLGVLGALAYGQEDPYRGIRGYDFQNRQAVDAIQARIRNAGKDAAKLAAIETQLIAVLKDPAATLAGKQEVCKFLWSMGTARSVPALEAMLLADQRQADAARYALEHIPGPEASAALRRALTKTQGLIRVGVANSLGVRRDALAVPLLSRLVANKDRETRTAAIRALGRIGTVEAFQTLRRLRGRDITAAQALLKCSMALVKAGKSSIAMPTIATLTAASFPKVVRVAALRALASFGSSAVDALAAKMLTDPDPYIQRGAAMVCVQFATSPSTKKIAQLWSKLPANAKVVLLSGWADRNEPLKARIALAAAQNESGAVQIAAIRAAARCAGATAVPVLAAIAAKNTDASAVAREALAAMPGQAAAAAIVRLSAGGTVGERAALMAVLAERPGKASLDALVAGARSADEAVATAALRGLQAVGSAEQVPAMTSILSATSHDSVREAAARAIVACIQRSPDRSAATAQIIRELESSATSARIAMLGVLAEVGGPASLEELRKAAMSSDVEIKRAAIQGLAETWSDASARPILLDIARADSQRTSRVLALRGYLRLVAQDAGMSPDDKVAAVEAALEIAERPEEKRQLLGVLRDCRTERSVVLATQLLEDKQVFAEAAETILDLAVPQNRNNRDLPAVQGSAVATALDRIIALADSDALKDRARKLK